MIRLAVTVAGCAALALGGAGCSTVSSGLSSLSQQIADMPSPVGLPAGTPARPAEPQEYPPVHENPPARDLKLLSVDERKKLEEDLAQARDHQSAKTGGPKKTAKAEKKAAKKAAPKALAE